MLIRKNHLNLIRKIAWSFYNSTGIEWQELFSEASLAYCEALQSYNPERGKITTHLWNCMKSQLLNFIKQENKYRSPLCPLNGTEVINSPSYSFEYTPLLQAEFLLKKRSYLKQKYGWSDREIEQTIVDIKILTSRFNEN
jgi:hypothetical protein